MTKKRILVLAATVMTAFSLVACGSKGSSASANSTTAATSATLAEAATGETYTGTGYTITLPEGWETASNSSCDFYAYNANTESLVLPENVNVVMEDVSRYTAMDASTYSEAAQKQFANSSNYNVTGTDTCTVNGKDAATLTCDVSQSGITYKCMQLYVVENGTAYVVTFSADPDMFEESLSVARSIMASLKIQ